LEGMQFHCCHGCFGWEKTTPQDFVVDVAISCDVEAAAKSDDLEDTIDYGAVFDIVGKRMAVPANLLEHLASSIADDLSAAFPQALSIDVCVSKLNPPVPGRAARSKVSVTIPGHAGEEAFPGRAARSKVSVKVPAE